VDPAKTIRRLVLIAYIVIILIIGSMGYSVLYIKFEPSTSLKTSVVKDLYAFSAPFNLTNGGFYDIDNFNVYVEIKNSTGHILVNNNTVLPPIPAYTKYQGNIWIALNATDLYAKKAYYLLFHDDTLQFRFRVGLGYGKYGVSVAGFKIDAALPITWGAPIKNLKLSVNTSNPTISYANKISVSFPCTVSYSGWLSISNIKVRSTVLNSTGTIIASNETTLPTLSPGTNKFNFNATIPSDKTPYYLSHDDTFQIKAELAAYDVSFSETTSYNWGAPLRDIAIGNITKQAHNATHTKLIVPFSGINNSPNTFSVTVKAYAYNVTGGGTLAGTGQSTSQFLSGKSLSDQVEIIIKTPSSAGQSIKIRVDFTSTFTYTLEKMYTS